MERAQGGPQVRSARAARSAMTRTRRTLRAPGPLRAALFVLGCALVAFAIDHVDDLSIWSQQWGTGPALMAFVAVIAAGVGCFYVGAATIVARLIG